MFSIYRAQPISLSVAIISFDIKTAHKSFVSIVPLKMNYICCNKNNFSHYWSEKGNDPENIVVWFFALILFT